MHRNTTSFETHDPSGFIELCDKALMHAGFAADRSQPLCLLSEIEGVQLEISGRDNHVKIALSAEAPDMLTAIRAAVQAQLQHLNPDLEDLAWTGAGRAGELAPNFSFAHVESCRQISDEFLRLELHGSDLARFAKNGMHFRILRQRDLHAAPVWPRLTEKGSVDWFESDPQLIHRAYTARYVDTRNHLITVDIYKHDGGPTCAWAGSNPIGETIGLTGPGGGWMPDAGWVCLAGDETAQPAILRMLEELPAETEGRAVLLAGAPGGETPFENRTKIAVEWLYRSQGADLVQHVAAVPLRGAADQYFWFAAEKAQARAMRQHFKGVLGLERSQFVSASYWEQGKSNRRD